MMHGFRCEFCGKAVNEAGPNEPCQGGMELRIAADALARVVWCLTQSEHEPTPDGWHVHDHGDAVTYSITLRPTPRCSCGEVQMASSRESVQRGGCVHRRDPPVTPPA